MISETRAKCLAMERYMELLGPDEIARHRQQSAITCTNWGNPLYVTFDKICDGYISRVICRVDRKTGAVRVRYRSSALSLL